MSPRTSERGATRSGERGPAVTPGRVAVLLLAVFALIFIFQNTRHTRIRLLIPEVTMPLSTALLVAALIGSFFGAYVMRRRR
ncbi:LapA family protein [Streptomyces guryensis]|uniref:LapA family protein n=1 Tax=Streptomyces guryensis TaxID=2886947 RepID=A0A9Q3ZC89_9ACTN|nr:LapA family protein [Streptomyces guryensis]MCD9877140.1 LapA family protein [Streptomyces guryensis]